MPFIYFFYPEVSLTLLALSYSSSVLTSFRSSLQTSGRTLEEMDILFSSDSILVHRQERDLAIIAENEPEVYHAVRLCSFLSLSSCR